MQLSLFSVSYAGLWGQARLDVEEVIAKAAQLGYDAVMLAGKRPHLSPLEATEEKLSSVEAALRDHGVECAALAGYVDFAGGGAAEVPYLEMQIAYAEQLAATAGRLHAKFVRLFTSHYGHRPFGYCRRFAIALQRTALPSLCRTITTSRYTAKHSWNWLTTSIVPTANSASMPGHQLFVVNRCTKLPG
jgi:sugar phosphate isomerase/epimerase